MSESWAILKAAFIAIIVAILIWIWAEGESLARKQTEVVEVRFPIEAGNDLVIRPDDPDWKGVVRITLEGSVRAVDRAATEIGKEIRLSAALEGMPSSPVAKFPLRMRDPISKLPALADVAGVIAEVSPEFVLVSADRMVTRSFPVRVELATPSPLDGQPLISPPSVEVRLPEPAAAALAPDAAAIAYVTDEMLLRIRNDGPQTLALPVRFAALSSGIGAISPESVAVTLRLKLAIESAKLPTVPVWFSLPPTEDGGKWDIEIIDKFLSDVTVSGVAEDVIRVRTGMIAVKAMIEFSSDELERAASANPPAPITKQAVCMGLPAGMSCSIPNPAVKVRIARASRP